MTNDFESFEGDFNGEDDLFDREREAAKFGPDEDEETQMSVNSMLARLCAGVLIAFLLAGFFASLSRHSESHLGTEGLSVESER